MVNLGFWKAGDIAGNWWLESENRLRGLSKSHTRNWIRQYPALVNCTTINWFSEWPREALLEVAEKYLLGVDLGTQENVRACSPSLIPALILPNSCVHQPLLFFHFSSVHFRSTGKWHRSLSPCTGPWLSIPRRCCWSFEDTTMSHPPTTWNSCLDIRSRNIMWQGCSSSVWAKSCIGDAFTQPLAPSVLSALLGGGPSGSQRSLIPTRHVISEGGWWNDVEETLGVDHVQGSDVT